MTSTAPSIRWVSILLASVGVWVFGFLLIALTIFGYGISLGFAARSAPDPAAIQQFASTFGSSWGPRLGIVLTAAAALWLGRRTTTRAVLHGFLIGLVVGGVPLVVRQRFGIEPLLTFLAILLAGALGAWLGRQLKGGRSTLGPAGHA